jgi:hypothetical protein
MELKPQTQGMTFQEMKESYRRENLENRERPGAETWENALDVCKGQKRTLWLLLS